MDLLLKTRISRPFSWFITVYIHIHNLVGRFNPCEKYEFVSWDYYFQYMETKIQMLQTINQWIVSPPSLNRSLELLVGIAGSQDILEIELWSKIQRISEMLLGFYHVYTWKTPVEWDGIVFFSVYLLCSLFIRSWGWKVIVTSGIYMELCLVYLTPYIDVFVS